MGDWKGDEAETEWKGAGHGQLDGEGVDGGLLCPRCLKFEGKNSRSLKTHMRYCNKGDVMRYIELSASSKGKDRCECGFTSPVPKGLQSHQLTCELIKRRLNQSQIGQIPPGAKIRMWITTQWYTGTVTEHTPTAALPHLYRIRFRAKGEKPRPYDLEQFNFRLIPRKTPNGKGTKRKFKDIEHDPEEPEEKGLSEDDVGGDDAVRGRGKERGRSVGGKRELRPRKRKKKKRRKVEDPHFVYLHDITRYRHQLFNRQYNAFQNYVDDWLCKTRQFLKQYD